MVAERRIVGQDVRPGGGDVAVVGLLRVAALTGGVAVLGTAVTVVLGDIVVDGNRAAEGQVRDEGDLGEVSRGDLVHVGDILVVGRIGQHVPAGPVGTVGTVLVDVVAVGVGGVAALRIVILPDVESGRHRTEEPHHGVACRGVGVGMGEGGVGAHFQPLLHMRGDVGTAGDTLKLLGRVDTLVVQVAAGEIVVRVALAAAQVHIVLLAWTDLEEFAAPVAVPQEVVIGHEQVAVGVDDVARVPRNHLEFVREVVRREGAGFRRGVAAVDGRVVQALPGHPGVLGRSQLPGQRNGHGSKAQVGTEGNLAVLALALLRGDHDDAVCGTGTVQGGCSRVLQDRHGLDVAGGDGVDVAGIGHTVHHIERGTRGVHGADTADVDGTAVTRLTAGVDDLHARAETLQGLRHVGRGNLLDVLFLDDRGRSRKGGLGGGTVRDHDGFVEHLAVVLEDDVDLPAAIDRYGLFLIPQAGHMQDTVLRDGEPEGTRGVTHGIYPVVAAQDHACTHDRIPGSVLHRSPHVDVLCGGGPGRHQAYQGSE